MVVVFDSSVLVPMILKKASRSARLFHRLRAAGHHVATSKRILQEVGEKLRTKEKLQEWLEVSDEEIDQYLAGLQDVCLVVEGLVNAHGAVPADPDDDIIIEAAILSSAKPPATGSGWVERAGD